MPAPTRRASPTDRSARRLRLAVSLAINDVALVIGASVALAQGAAPSISTIGVVVAVAVSPVVGFSLAAPGICLRSAAEDSKKHGCR